MEQHEIIQGDLVHISHNARFPFPWCVPSVTETFHWIGTVWKIDGDKALVAVMLPGIQSALDRRWYKLTDLTNVRDFHWSPNDERSYLEYLQYVGNDNDWEHPDKKCPRCESAMVLTGDKIAGVDWECFYCGHFEVYLAPDTSGVEIDTPLDGRMPE